MDRRGEILAKILGNCKREGACLIWQGSCSGNGRGGGYPRMSLDGQTVAVHRVLFTHFHGYIPGKKQIDHLCCNRLCLNIAHLEKVTHKENQKRRDNQCRVTYDQWLEMRKLACIDFGRGHQFTDEELDVMMKLDSRPPKMLSDEGATEVYSFNVNNEPPALMPYPEPTRTAHAAPSLSRRQLEQNCKSAEAEFEALLTSLPTARERRERAQKNMNFYRSKLAEMIGVAPSEDDEDDYCHYCGEPIE